jgi:NAD+ kinase
MTLTSPATAAAVLPESPRMAVLASPAPAAQAALEELSRSRTWAPLDEADVLVTVGGDGTLLHALHRLASAGLQVPVFGLHRGTTGFLLNAWRREEDLELRLRTARPECVVPLLLTASGPDGQARPPVLAYNEVALRRTSSQSARLACWWTASSGCRSWWATACWSRRRPAPPPTTARPADRSCR